MTPELLISIISLIATFIVGVLTLVVNIRVGKMENTEALHKYEKNITNFELQFKDEQWLYNLIQNGEFDHYNLKSKKRISSWWAIYSRKYTPVLLIPHVNYNELKVSGADWFGSNGISTGGKMVEMVMPGDDLPNAEDLF